MELILEMRKQGWFWTEEYIWHKKTVSLGNGQIDLEIPGKDCYNLIKVRNFICIRRK